MQRRTFLKSLTVAAGSLYFLREISGAIAEDLNGLSQALSSARDEPAFWNEVRRQFLLNPGIAHLNCGSVGATPMLVLDAVTAFMHQLEGNPVPNVFGTIGAKMEEVRGKAAQFLGADVDEIVLTRNTTEGMNSVATGLRLKPGDEVLTTNHEHPGGHICWEYLAKHFGIKIVTIPMPAPVRDKAQILQLIKDHITDRTRVCSFSHVETITGLQMPMADIAAITRPRGILLVCDGAQSPGMLKVDVKALGVDAFASSSHKWMLSPKGCGLLYIRKEVQERIQPVFLFSGYRSYSASSGTRNVPQILGHGVAMDFHNTIGRDRIEARCRSLAQYLRQRLQPIAALELLSPSQPELSSAIVTYRLKKGNNRDIAQRLKEKGIIVKVVPKQEYNALRFSTHIFNSRDEIDRLADALRQMFGS